jgi:hypothetical protein
MKPVLEITHRLVLIIIPVVATSAIAAFPSQAATLSFSGGSAVINGFSHTPYSTGTFTDTDTNTFALSGNVQAIANANAIFVPQPVVAGSNSSITQVNGAGSNYLGNAQSQAAIVGRFQINSGEAFSFNFLTALQLETSVDNPSFESAFADGSIQFNLFDNSTGGILDSFGLFGQLTQPGTNLFGFESSNSLQQVEFLNPYFSTETRSLSFTQFSGNYMRTFDSSVDVTLAESKVNRAGVRAVPEPSSFLGLGLFAALILLRKRYFSR